MKRGLGPKPSVELKSDMLLFASSVSMPQIVSYTSKNVKNPIDFHFMFTVIIRNTEFNKHVSQEHNYIIWNIVFG